MQTPVLWTSMNSVWRDMSVATGDAGDRTSSLADCNDS